MKPYRTSRFDRLAPWLLDAAALIAGIAIVVAFVVAPALA